MTSAPLGLEPWKYSAQLLFGDKDIVDDSFFQCSESSEGTLFHQIPYDILH